MKTKKGRPKKEPTTITSIRVSLIIDEFLKSLENKNDFLIALITETEEFQKFQRLKREEENTKYIKASIFDEV